MGKLRKYFLIYIAVILILGSFATGLFIGRGRRAGDTEIGWQIFSNIIEGNEEKPSEVDFSLFWQVWNVIEEKFMNGPLDYQEMVYGAISGMIDSLGDPYTVFMKPQEAEEFEQEMQGKFEGIGAEIGIRNDRLTIIAPLADSPAEQAGLRARDVVIQIDDYGAIDISLLDAVMRIRGEKGTEVILKVLREGVDDPFEIKIVRDEIKVESVKWEIKENKIALIEISRFGEETEDEFEKAVGKILNSDPKGIVLDLRNNPGGYLDTAVQIGSEFIPKKEVVAIEEFAGGEQSQFKSKGPVRLQGLPIIVLVNEGSASASEILGGALQDYGIARLVGKKTFGKGSVQQLEEFNDGSKVRVTIAKWLTPKGRYIHDEGIEPDFEVELSNEDINADRDPQMERAMELLTGE